MGRISIVILISSLAGCTGNLPAGNALPRVDGGQLTGVNAATLDGVRASAGADASTIVQRDGSGNFTAGTITASLNGNASSATTATSATYALGKAGAVASSADVLVIPSDGDYFAVTGTHEIKQLSILPEGARVRFRVSDRLLLRHGSQLELLGRKDYRTDSGDTFELVSRGELGWTELSRQVARPGDVFKVNLGNSPATIPNSGAAVTIQYGSGNVAELDDLNQYVAGVFTAFHGGLYQLTAQYLAVPTNPSSWSVGQGCDLYFVAPRMTIVGRGSPLTAGSSCVVHVNFSVDLAPGEKFSLAAIAGGTGIVEFFLLNGSQSMNYLRVVRARD